ncbi:MaoC family dehydratase [Pseudarthrobacter sp. J1738]|uniref:MaoC family dehydratase n=1 Tax=Pseudarthrobacter sp. J1738 TaxID=3420446 RepID=UPI003D276316
MSTPSVQVLGETPSLSKLYLNAAALAARKKLLGHHEKPELPAVAHEVADVEIDLEKLTAYQKLFGLPVSDAVPSGYVHVLGFPLAVSLMTKDEFPLPLLGMIHLQNRVEHFGKIERSQRMDIRSWAENLSGHRAGTKVDLVVEVRAAHSDDLLWRGISTYLAKGVFLPGIDKPTTQPPKTDFAPPNPTAVWRLGADAGRAYAAVSGDFNPIHLSSLSAKALGLRTSIVHGMYVASRALAEIGTSASDSFVWNVSFEAPVFLPATVGVRIEAEEENGPAADVAALEGNAPKMLFVGWNQRSGRRHFTGSVEPILPN